MVPSLAVRIQITSLDFLLVEVGDTTKFRIIILPFFSIVGLYFGYDEVGAIAPKLQEQLGLTLTDIGWLYRLVRIWGLIQNSDLLTCVVQHLLHSKYLSRTDRWGIC